MAGRKSNVVFKAVTAGDMASAIISPASNVEHLDNICYQINYTGSPVGSIAIEGSVDYNQDSLGNVLNAGNWAVIASLAIPASTSPIVFDLNQLGVPWVRCHYTASSGTGSADIIFSAKMV